MRVGPYELRDEIGQGASGRVFRALAPDGSEVALKLLLGCSPAAVQRFVREARLQGSLGAGEGFVPLLDAGQDGQGRPYLVMPLFEGGSLADRLARGRLGVEKARQVGITLARALGAAHARGVVHRDVKPSNVLFDGSGRALLADLGLARLFGEGAAGVQSVGSRTGELRGTIGYAAPEQLLDAKRAGPPADVFALGAVLYECLSGQAPFVGPTLVEYSVQASEGRRPPLRRAQPEVPVWLAQVIEKALRPAPEERWADGDELARALAAGGALEQVGVTPAGRGLLLIAGAVVLAGVLVAGGVLVGRRSGGAGGGAVAGIEAPPGPPRDGSPSDGSPGDEAPRDEARDPSLRALRAACEAGGAPPVHVCGSYEGLLPTPAVRIVPLPGRGELALLPAPQGLPCTTFVGPWITDGRGVPRLRLDHQGASLVSVSRDGRRLASVVRGEVKVWDVASGRVVSTVPTGLTRISCLALSPDGARVAIGSGAVRSGVPGQSHDPQLTVWDVERARQERLLVDLTGTGALAVWFLPGDGERVGLVSADGLVRVFDAASGEEQARLQTRDEGDRARLHQVAVSVEAGVVVVDYEGERPGERPGAQEDQEEGTLSWWSLDRGSLVRRALRPGSGPPRAMAVPPGGDGLILVTPDGLVVRLRGGRPGWDVLGEAEREWDPPGLAFEGGRAIVGGRALRVAAFEADEARLPDVAPSSHQRAVQALTLTDDGARIVSCDDLEVAEWDPRGGSALVRQRLFEEARPGSYCLVAGTGDRLLAEVRQELWTWERGAAGWAGRQLGGAALANRVHASHDGQVLIEQLGSGFRRLDLRGGGSEPLGAQGGPRGRTLELALAPDGRALVLRDMHARCELWDPLEGRALAELPWTASGPLALTDPPRRLVWGEPGAIRLERLDGGETQRVPWPARLRGQEPFLLAAARDGSRVAAATLGGEVLVGRPGQPEWTLDLHPVDDGVSALAFSGDARSLLVGTCRGLVLRFELQR